MVLYHPHHPHHPPPPPLRPPQAPQHGALIQGRVGGSWTGCCQKKDLFTDVQSTQSSEKGSSRGFLQDTKFTGEWDVQMCLFVTEGQEQMKGECILDLIDQRGSRKCNSPINLSAGLCVSHILQRAACLLF